MSTHVSETQVRRWLDENAIQEVTAHPEETTEFNLEVRLSRLPIHVIKEEEFGPLRLVGQSAFDTEHSRSLVRDESERRELLESIGPALASTPGFYTFLDENGESCEFRNVHRLQVEYRLYPDEASQQALNDGVMAIATGMRYVQNVIAARRSGPGGEAADTAGSAEAEESTE